MKYWRAEELLPAQFVRELQQYVQGGYLYIPAPQGTRRGWGEVSGSRENLARRNEQIRQRFAQGQTIEALADDYYLSVYTIRKIVYHKS